MRHHKSYIFAFLSTFLIALLAQTAFAEARISRVSVLNADMQVATDQLSDNEFAEIQSQADQGRRDKLDVCGFNIPETKTYRAEVIAVRNVLKVEPGEDFDVKVFVKNTGSMPWFSNRSQCLGPKMSLGTEKLRDAESVFYKEGLDGWEGNNRVAMDQYRADPGEVVSFSFTGHAGSEDNVYKQYFAPVLKDLEWIDDAPIEVDLIVGEPDANAHNIRKRLDYGNESGSLMKLDLQGEKRLVVDRSDQKLHVMLGDYEVRTFPVSTGAWDTPTPLGETKITLKQEVRVGGAPPHYVMPKFMWFRAGGYGFHALPSLANDNGIFWSEALDHIGIPVSHGCIRLLPGDADWLFEFTDIGTRVIVRQ